MLLQIAMAQGFCIYCRRSIRVSLQVVSFLWVFKIVENWCVICHLCAEWYCWRDGNWENLQGQFQRQARPHCPCDASRKTGDFRFVFVLMGLIKVHYLQLLNFGKCLHIQIRGSYALILCAMDIFLHVEHKYSSRTNQAVGVFLGECNFEPSWGTGADDLVDWLQGLGA